jgi:hypothetical protein
MGMIQLIAVGSDEHPKIEYRDNQADRSLRSFATDTERPLLWSSADLVHVAVKLREHGFRVTQANVTDAGRRPIDPESLTSFIRILNKSDERSAHDYLARDDVDGFVQMVMVSSRAAHSTFRLLQNGRVDSKDSADPEELVAALSAP